MEITEELKRWIAALSAAEKRHIKLVGKARSGSDSQQLGLFDWLNNNPDETDLPEESKLRQNYPTVASRLRELILDSLYMLHKSDSAALHLHTSIGEAILLYEKKIFRSASRILRRTKKQAIAGCHYEAVAQCISWEYKIATATAQSRETLQQLRDEEVLYIDRLAIVRDLRHRHDILLALIRQYFFHRDAGIMAEVRQLADSPSISEAVENGNFFEQAIATDIIGLRCLYERNPAPVLSLYQQLIRRWKENTSWQEEHGELLLRVCKSYLNICFYSPVNWDEVQEYLVMMSGFSGMRKDELLHFREIIFQQQFALALNTGRFDHVRKLLPEIDSWIESESASLSEAQFLPFLCNFMVACFLDGGMQAANRYAIRILNSGNKKIRVDIRDYALVLQAIIQYELGNEGLNEYLTRAGKRHFRKNVTYEINFELIVFRHLEKLLKADSEKEKKKIFSALAEVLDQLASEIPASVPLLGLREVTMWAKAHRQNEPLRDVFLEEVKKNLAALQEAGGHVRQEER